MEEQKRKQKNERRPRTGGASHYIVPGTGPSRHKTLASPGGSKHREHQSPHRLWLTFASASSGRGTCMPAFCGMAMAWRACITEGLALFWEGTSDRAPVRRSTGAGDCELASAKQSPCCIQPQGREDRERGVTGGKRQAATATTTGRHAQAPRRRWRLSALPWLTRARRRGAPMSVPWSRQDGHVEIEERGGDFALVLRPFRLRPRCDWPMAPTSQRPVAFLDAGTWLAKCLGGQPP